MSNSPSPLIYIISAPSGSGKSTLAGELLRHCPDAFIIRCNDDLRKAPGLLAAFHHMLDERFAADQGQRLARKTS